MTIPDEKFFAWLDGELPPKEAALVEAEVAKSPDLTGAAEQHRAMQARLKAAFDTVVQAPVPERLRPKAELIDFAAAKRARDERRWGSPAQWAAMAATLAVGIFAGTLIVPRANGPVEVQGGRLYAAASLNRALDTELASAPGTGAVRIGLTFRDQTGAVCRTFTDPQSSGLACRNGSGWQLRGLFGAPEGQSGTYRMAGGMDPDLAALVDSTMAGDPLDAAQEKAAKVKGWR
jgi:hypothetical protein